MTAIGWAAPFGFVRPLMPGHGLVFHYIGHPSRLLERTDASAVVTPTHVGPASATGVVKTDLTWPVDIKQA